MASDEFDKVCELFRAFFRGLPVDRIKGVPPRSVPRFDADNPDKYGYRLCGKLGGKFVTHMKDNLGRGPGEATWTDLADGMWSFWKKKLSNSHLRVELEVVEQDPKDRYRLNDLLWKGFWMTGAELEDAVRRAVTVCADRGVFGKEVCGEPACGWTPRRR